MNTIEFIAEVLKEDISKAVEMPESPKSICLIIRHFNEVSYRNGKKYVKIIETIKIR